MAKKIVRGITDVKTINNQDFDTNNVNDLLSDGQYNYIHRKKGKTEEYHNLTDNIKTISSDNTELLSVTNNNKTTNTATLHPKHDAQKEQVLESTRNTVNIQHGTNGTAEKTTVDTNPQKVLEHSNLTVDYGLSKATSGNTTKLGLEYTKADNFDLNELKNGRIRGANLLNAPSNEFYFVESFTEGRYCIQEAIKLTDYKNTTYKRLKYDGVWGEWREQVGEKSVIDDLLAQKQNKLTAGDGITIEGQTISARPKITFFSGEDYRAFKQVFKHVGVTFATYTFDCEPQFTECELRSTIELDLKKFVRAGMTVSNGAISISNDGTTMKLIKSGGSQNGNQQGTFTFYGETVTGGGGDLPPQS